MTWIYKSQTPTCISFVQLLHKVKMYINGEAIFINSDNFNSKGLTLIFCHLPFGLTPGHLYVLLLKLSHAFAKNPRDGFEVDQTDTYINSW